MTNIGELTEQLKQARGPEYTARLKYILKVLGPEIKNDFSTMREAFGKVTPVDIGIIVLMHNLNYKAVTEFLERERLVPWGTYERLIDGKMKVNEILEQSRAKLLAIQEGSIDEDIEEGSTPHHTRGG